MSKSECSPGGREHVQQARWADAGILDTDLSSLSWLELYGASSLRREGGLEGQKRHHQAHRQPRQIQICLGRQILFVKSAFLSQLVVDLLRAREAQGIKR